jgi:hypothetical protein
MGYGVGPYGYGTPVPDEPAADQTLGTSRRIGTSTENRGQYVLDDDSPAFDSDVRQLVILALTTVRGSCAIAGFGRSKEPADFGGNFVETKRAQVRDALEHLVSSKAIRIDDISVIETFAGRSFTRVLLTDLTRGQQIKVDL